MVITIPQLLVLLSYFLGVYAVKFAVTDADFISENKKKALRAMIPALNLCFGLLLGFFGLAEFDISLAVLSSLAVGGAADLVKMPKNVKKSLN